jgi:hypothetical protein
MCGNLLTSANQLCEMNRPRIERTPSFSTTDTIRVDFGSWVFLRSGMAFVWTPDGEM